MEKTRYVWAVFAMLSDDSITELLKTAGVVPASTRNDQLTQALIVWFHGNGPNMEEVKVLIAEEEKLNCVSDFYKDVFGRRPQLDGKSREERLRVYEQIMEEVERRKRCHVCKGKGIIMPSYLDHYTTCMHCGGSGKEPKPTA